MIKDQNEINLVKACLYVGKRCPGYYRHFPYVESWPTYKPYILSPGKVQGLLGEEGT